MTDVISTLLSFLQRPYKSLLISSEPEGTWAFTQAIPSHDVAMGSKMLKKCPLPNRMLNFPG